MRASRASLIAVLLAALLVGACGGAAVPAIRTGALQWTHRAFGEGHSTSHERLAVPFALDPQGTSGTVVIQGLLRAARARGARYLSDVAIALQLRRGDLPIECVSRIVLGPDPAAARAPAAPSGSFEPPQVEARVIDHELRCENRPSLVVRSGEEISVLFDDAIGSRTYSGTQIAPPRGRTEWEDHCELKSVERTVRRYDHLIAARFTPPDLALLGRDLGGQALVETAPVCRTLDVGPGAPLVQRIWAEVFYTGAPR